MNNNSKKMNIRPSHLRLIPREADIKADVKVDIKTDLKTDFKADRNTVDIFTRIGWFVFGCVAVVTMGKVISKRTT